MSTDRKERQPRKPRDQVAGDVKPAESVAKTQGKTIRQTEAAILQASMEGASPQQAVQAAGMEMKPRAARTYVKHVKEKYSDSNGHLLVALENVGVDLNTVAGKIRDGLEADTTTKSGKDVVTVPDFKTRHKYLETALDIMGGRAPTKSVVESVQTHEKTVAIVQSINGSPRAMEVLRQRMERREQIEITTEQEVDCGEG